MWVFALGVFAAPFKLRSRSERHTQDRRSMNAEFTRRQFLHTTSAATLATIVGPGALRAAEASPARRMIGIQVGAVSFLDEGVEQVLDIFQQKGAINTIFLTT